MKVSRMHMREVMAVLGLDEETATKVTEQMYRNAVLDFSGCTDAQFKREAKACYKMVQAA